MITKHRFDRYSVGDYGVTVCVYRRRPHGPFHAEVGNCRKVIMPRIRDAELACRWAHAATEARERGEDPFSGVDVGGVECWAGDRRPLHQARVYFIQDTASGRVKIGLAHNPRVRLEALQTACPTELKLIKAIAGGREVELLLHQEFAEYRVHGEWFEWNEKLAQFLAGTVDSD